MRKPRLSIIAAIGTNRELGKRNELIWHIPDDLKRFKTLTTGNPIIMGRNTHESIGRALPNRLNIVVTRSEVLFPGCITAHSLHHAIGIAESQRGVREIFVIGGAQIYEHALYYAERLYLTVIEAEDPEADTFFPEYPDFTKVIDHEVHEHEGLTFTYLTLERGS